MNKNLLSIKQDAFEMRSVVSEWTPGDTIKDILERVETGLSSASVVAVDGHIIKHGYFHVLRPKAGTMITVDVVPRDDGVKRAILSIAVAVASYYTFGLAGGGLAGALASGIVSVVGMLAVNALVPLNTELVGDGNLSSQLPGIGASRNCIYTYVGGLR